MCAILIVVALLGHQESPDSDVLATSVEPVVELTVEEPVPEIQKEEVEVIEEDIVIEYPLFRNIQYSLKGKSLEIEGDVITAYGQEPVQEQDIKVFCNGALVSDDEQTSTSGHFDDESEGDCKPGQDAWVSVLFNDKWYDSDKYPIAKEAQSGSGSSSSSGPSGKTHSSNLSEVVTSPTGVPEFSTSTLAIAIVLGCMGIAVLRKH